MHDPAAALPTGTVTLMLTDIEGSTRLWDAAPDAMHAGIARHYELLDAAIALHGGVRPVEQGEGDSTVSAFSSASGALAAALDVQRAFGAERWPTNAAVRIRIALHTGEAELRDERNYCGPAVNRCARMRAIANGGQVLLSRATRDLVVDRLADDLDLVDLGVHRLRDLGRQEHVFGLRHPELAADYAPLRSLDVLPNNLPTEMTSFVGRGAELAAVGELLAGSRLLTLTGTGGCGKTRLALQAAAEAIDAYLDGVWWIELARLEEPSLLARTVAAAIGLREVPGRAPLDVLIEHLCKASALLVLDNCEHVIAASAEAVTALGQACPALRILTTSRAPLGVPGELTWRVPSMSLPRSADDLIGELQRADAARLFVDRAALVRPNFAITSANAAAVAKICLELDGIPLAIELAATRVRMLTAEQIARGLDDRFHLLTRGARTAMPRQQTLRASIDWSHDLLSDDERVLLRRLSVFVGGCTLDAAEAVCSGNGIDRYAVLDLLAGLVDASLVVTRDQDAEIRYSLLETVRQYAATRLDDAGEIEAVRGRHRTYFVALAERAQPELVGAGAEDPIVQRLAVELPNIRAALGWAVDACPDDALRIVAALALFWLFTGRYREGDAAYARALDAAGGGQPSELRGFVLAARANLGLYGGDSENAPEWAKTALAIGKRLGSLAVEARALNTLGFMLALDDPSSGRQLLARAVELAGQVGDDWCGIDAQQCVAVAWMWQDGFDEARAALDDAYAQARPIGYRWGLAWHGFFRGIEAFYRGRLDEAGELFSDAIRAADDVGDPLTRAFAASSLALIELERGDAQAARDRATAALQRTLTTGALFAFGWVADRVARTEIALGELGPARAHLEAAITSQRTAYMACEHLISLATIELLEGNLAAAGTRGSDALATASRVRSEVLIARAERLLGRVALEDGDVARAERLIHDALGRLHAGRFALFIPECLDALAAVAATRESFEEAARLLGSATGARTQIGVGRFPPESGFWSRLERSAYDSLGGHAYDAAFASGTALTIDDAVAYARRARGERKRPSRGWDSLTPTELEVVRHVTAGLTNPQIGERMFIARGTVKVHLSHIFAKLGVDTRAQLAAEATRRDIPDG